mmetsp:Transcript_8032/g.7108  ORF Transcript_8032/g.7108 Transcript_8032/m.7108 type:complete len:81 (+) Transcript_8032:45-287(+)
MLQQALKTKTRQEQDEDTLVRKRNRNVKAKRRNTLDSGFWKLVSNNPQTLPKLYHTDRDFALQRNHIDTYVNFIYVSYSH